MYHLQFILFLFTVNLRLTNQHVGQNAFLTGNGKMLHIFKIIRDTLLFLTLLLHIYQYNIIYSIIQYLFYCRYFFPLSYLNFEIFFPYFFICDILFSDCTTLMQPAIRQKHGIFDRPMTSLLYIFKYLRYTGAQCIYSVGYPGISGIVTRYKKHARIREMDFINIINCKF